MIDTILAVAKTLFGFLGEFGKTRRDRRDRIADYFEHISQTLTDVSSQLKADQFPHGKCAEMQHYARMLADTVGDQIGKAQAEQLGKELESAHEVERLYHTLRQSSDKNAELAKLDEAAGMFMAIARSIRAAP